MGIILKLKGAIFSIGMAVIIHEMKVPVVCNINLVRG